MKPKKIICPICGEEMIAKEWGMKRNIMRDVIGLLPLSPRNYVTYECSCGCTINYEGEKDCWQKCKCKEGDTDE